MALVKILKHSTRTGQLMECRVLRIAPDGTVTQLDHADGIFRASPATPKVPLVEVGTTGLFTRAESRSAWADGNYVLIANVVGTASPDGGVEFQIKGDAEVVMTDPPAKESTLTTIYNRLGAFTGTGVNTVLGFFKALLKKDGAIPSDIGGTFDPATDSTEALSERLNNVGGLTGAHTVTVQFYRTATVTPIPDVLCDVYDSTETTRLNGTQIKSDVNGRISFSRDNGTYKVRAMLAGFTFTTGTVVVADGNATLTMYGAVIAADPPIAADAIRVYEFCFMPDGATPMPTASVKAKAHIINLPYDYNGRYHSGQLIDGVYSVATGKVYWDIAPGATTVFEIRDVTGGAKTATVPLTAVNNTIRLKEIV